MRDLADKFYRDPLKPYDETHTIVTFLAFTSSFGPPSP